MKNTIKNLKIDVKKYDKKSADKNKLKIKFSADFLLYIIFALGLGQVLQAFSYAFAVILHESVHYYVAEKRGYRCKELVFSAFGAVLYGDFEIMNKKDEITVAVAAPVANLCVAVFFVACWWLFPATYLFTDEIVSANAAMGLCNLLPCFPLDGGRIVSAAMRDKRGIKASLRLVRRVNYSVAAVISAVFIYGIIVGQPNFNALSFIFLIVFNASASKPPSTAVYVKRTFHELYSRRISRGISVDRVSFDEKSLLFDAYRSCTFGKLWLIDVFSEGKVVSTLSVLDVEDAVFSLNAGATLKDTVAFYHKKRGK